MKKVILVLALAVISTTYIISKIGYSILGGIEGNGEVVKKEIQGIDGFTKVALGFSGDIVLTQGSDFKVVYDGESNILDKIKFEVKGKSLNIDWKDDNWNIRTTKKITVYVTMPNLDAVALGGSGDISSTNDFNGDSIDVAISGSGDVALTGTYDRMNLTIGGSGDCNLYKLKAKKGNVAISGSGNCNVAVSDDLSVVISGSGDVTCKGTPQLRKMISGSGEVTMDR